MTKCSIREALARETSTVLYIQTLPILLPMARSLTFNRNGERDCGNDFTAECAADCGNRGAVEVPSRFVTSVSKESAPHQAMDLIFAGEYSESRGRVGLLWNKSGTD